MFRKGDTSGPSQAHLGTLLVVALTTGCPNPAVDTPTYFEQRIAPILTENCVRGTADAKCHTERPDEMGVGLGEAQGNLDLTSFASLRQRPELLRPYGSYVHPILLVKATKPNEIGLPYGDRTLESQILHAGGGILSAGSEGFAALATWLANGATEDGRPAPLASQSGSGPCRETLRTDVAPFLDQATGESYDGFVSKVQGILQERCSSGTCHGSPASGFYLTCGSSEAQIRQNYVVARSFVAPNPARSELLLRPLEPSAGGVPHSGGHFWSSTDDAEYQALAAWAEATGPLDTPLPAPEFSFFRDEVMPVLIARGCAMPQCHAPHGFNDYRLQPGSRGALGPLALRRNYEDTRTFINVDTPDPNQSRLVKKNISAGRGGIAHRAGVLLLEERDQGGDPSLCDAPSASTQGRSPYCTLVEWIRLEREAALREATIAPLAPGDTVPIVYVDRPANPDRAIDFATFRGDARLMRLDATLGEKGVLSSFGAPIPIDLSGCDGVSAASASEIDIRGPEVSYDGRDLVFALRIGSQGGLDIYRSGLDGSRCTRLTVDGRSGTDGIPIHNFDPVFVPRDPRTNPNGAIVFASTRAGAGGGPHLSPRYALPASNLWSMGEDGGAPRQMTFLGGSELSPAMMQSGKVTMTTEKATPGFYQLAGRRINWDLTDYHPLLAQRGTIGFEQATEIRERPDHDFVFIGSKADDRFSGGDLVLMNRSVGTFEAGRSDRTYLPSVDTPARRMGVPGLFRSPFPALDRTILVSHASGPLDPTDASARVDFDLIVFDPVSGERRLVAGGGDGRFQVDGVLAYPRAARKAFFNEPALVFGGGVLEDAATSDRAYAHFVDAPMLFTLLTQNLRRGRDLATMKAGDVLAVYASRPRDGNVPSDGETFQSLDLLGTVPLAADGSAFVDVPASRPVVLELRRGDQSVLRMTEEHQFGPGEMTGLGVSRTFFDGVCGGCHGSVSGRELDVVVNPDALTGASTSLSRPSTDSRPTARL